jgi:hypothetical protein
VATTTVQKRWERALVVLLATLVGTAVAVCAPSSTAIAAPGLDAEWHDEADRTVALIQGVSRMAGLARSTTLELQDLRRSTDELITWAPELRTDEDDVLLRHLAAAQPFEALVAEVDAARASFSAPAAEVAAVSTPDQRVQARLAENGREILHDAACESAHSLMTPEEVVEADETGWRPHVRDLDLEPVGGAIVRFGQKSVSGFFGKDAVRLVSWDRFGQGMAEKISTYGDGLAGTVQNPDPHSMFVCRTRAFVHYARTCLVPPR